MIDRKAAKRRFAIQRNEAKLREVEWNLTFEQWDEWWQTNSVDKNFPTKHSADQLCMCRIGDTGAYSLDNIYCATRSQNAIDNRQNNSYGLPGNLNPAYGKSAVNSKSVLTPKGIFSSQTQAGRELGINVSTLKTLIKNKPQEYSYV
jgi:hypothetical protein